MKIEGNALAIQGNKVYLDTIDGVVEIIFPDNKLAWKAYCTRMTIEFGED